MSATIGVPRRRVDGEQKVRGATRYAADLPIAGVLHGRLVLATEAHARVTGIDAEAARAMPGVVAVLTAADLPVSPNAPGRAGEPLAREEVVFAGQPVALVVAETEAAAEDAVDAVIVDLEPLEAVLDLEAAMAPGAPRARAVEQDRGGHDLGGAHASVDAGDDDQPEEDLSDNVGGRQRLANGDGAGRLPAAALTGSRPLRTTGRSPAGCGRGGSTRPISSRRARPRGSTSTARSSCRARRRARSPPARGSPSCSTCRSTASAFVRRRSAARSAASSCCR